MRKSLGHLIQCVLFSHLILLFFPIFRCLCHFHTMHTFHDAHKRYSKYMPFLSSLLLHTFLCTQTSFSRLSLPFCCFFYQKHTAAYVYWIHGNVSPFPLAYRFFFQLTVYTHSLLANALILGGEHHSGQHIKLINIVCTVFTIAHLLLLFT